MPGIHRLDGWARLAELAGRAYSPHYPGLFHRLSTIFAGLFHSFVNAAGMLCGYDPIRFLPGAIDETYFHSINPRPSPLASRLIAAAGWFSPSARAQTRARLCRAAGGAGSQRRRPQRRQAPRSAAVPAIRRAAARHEGARYGRRRRLFDRADGARGGAERRRLCAEPARSRRQAQGGVRGAAENAGDERRRRRHPAVRRSDSARRARSRYDHLPVLLPRHQLHERRPRRDGQQDVRRAQARRHFW